MEISIYCFTDAGKELSYRIQSMWDDTCMVSKVSGKALRSAIQSNFEEDTAMVFVGAVGMAVRLIANHVNDKLSDPPVVVIDERGQYVIPILSGHVGAANDLANELATLVKGIPVITTATDINGKFAIDVFASKNKLFITDKDKIKKISSRILSDETIQISSSFSVEGTIPDQVVMVKYPPRMNVDVIVSENVDDSKFCTLHLIPKRIVLGIDCKKGIDADVLKKFVVNQLNRCNITLDNLSAITSINSLSSENAISSLTKGRRIPFNTYSIEELVAAEGEFDNSDFIEEPISDIAARSALLCGKEGFFMLKKAKCDGISISIFRSDVRISFDE